MKTDGQQDVLSTQLIMLSLSEILAESLQKKGFLLPGAHETIMGHYISASSSWLELFPSQKRTGTALSDSSGLQHSSAPSLLCLVPKVTCECVHAYGGEGWLLEGSAVPVCFIEKSALGCNNEWSGCIAKGKSLSFFTSCRD